MKEGSRRRRVEGWLAYRDASGAWRGWTVGGAPLTEISRGSDDWGGSGRDPGGDQEGPTPAGEAAIGSYC